MNKEDQEQLPYNLDIKLFEEILSDLRTTGQNEVKLGTLWVNVSASGNPNRSYTLNMAKYLDLVDTDKTNVWLTDFGVQTFKYSSGDKRKITLSNKLPERYKAMFKWIKNSGELLTSEIKGEYVKNFGAPKSSIVFDKAITSFLTYCDYLKIIKYSGKGNAAKATVTEFGRTVFDQESSEIQQETTLTTESPKQETVKKIKLPKGVYPIIIKTPDREIPYDIRTEKDFPVIDSIIASIKDDWRISQKKSPVEGGDDE
ncbi:MAG: hypothetical protein J4F36_11925 [Nitrosopumilaceae archaeon]|nr:hypothetical protein [Nitrosopumilaceae archaeon]